MLYLNIPPFVISLASSLFHSIFILIDSRNHIFIIYFCVGQEQYKQTGPIALCATYSFLILKFFSSNWVYDVDDFSHTVDWLKGNFCKVTDCSFYQSIWSFSLFPFFLFSFFLHPKFLSLSSHLQGKGIKKDCICMFYCFKIHIKENKWKVNILRITKVQCRLILNWMQMKMENIKKWHILTAISHGFPFSFLMLKKELQLLPLLTIISAISGNCQEPTVHSAVCFLILMHVPPRCKSVH